MEDPTDGSCPNLGDLMRMMHRDRLDSHLAEPEDADTSLDDLMERMRKDIEAGIYQLRPEKSHSGHGDEPFPNDGPFDTLLEESFCNSDYSYHVETQSAVFTTVEMNNSGRQMTNPLDLTRRFSQSAPNTPTKRRKADLRQTNAGYVRSPPPILTRLRSLSNIGQPKRGPAHQQTQSRSSQAPPGARLDPTPNTKMAKLRAQTKAKAANKASPLPSAAKNVERIFEDLTNDFGPEISVYFQNSQPSTSTSKLPKQPIVAGTSSEDSSTANKRQSSVRPSFVRQDPLPSLLDSEDELDDVHMSSNRSPLRSITNDKLPAGAAQPLSSPTSTQKPTLTEITITMPDDDGYPRDFAVQRELCGFSTILMQLLIMTVSGQIHDYIQEAVGNVDGRVHRIFKDVALKTSLWIVSLFRLAARLSNQN